MNYGNGSAPQDATDTGVALTMKPLLPPLVSIVIPAYNHATYLDEAIQSILKQDYPNIELIVLDDGSTDNTRAVLAKYAGMFHWETHKNMGQANTLNKGWQMSKGEVLSYLSADDVLLPHAVSTSMKYLRDDVVLTYCDFNLIDPSSKIIRRVLAPEFNYAEMFVKFICYPGPGVFMARKAFEKAGLWNSSLRQMPDYDYWLRLGLVGDFKRVPELLACFRVHDESQTHAKADERKADEPVNIIRGFIESQKLAPAIEERSNEALSNAHLISAQLHIRANRFGRGIENLRVALFLYPRILLKLRTYRTLFNSLFNHLLHKLVRLKNQFG
jgi:glycosyltransferase involved in cell wall biosynthesis